MADGLLELVLEGRKRATAEVVNEFVPPGTPLPRVGGHWIVLDGRGTPRCVLRTVELRVGLLTSVDDAFAWDEGEGDRTREDWLSNHRRFFHRRAAARAVVFDESREQVLFERFELVWPPE